jgi:hypothetical protein
VVQRTLRGRHGRAQPILCWWRGLRVVRQEAARVLGQGRFVTLCAPQPPGWALFEPLFQLQAVYLLLWTIAERVAAFGQGPDLDPVERLRALEQRDKYRDAFFARGWFPGADHAQQGRLGRDGGEGRGPSPAARDGEGGAVQVTIVDSGVADGANKRQVGRDRARREPPSRVRSRCQVVMAWASSLARGRSPKTERMRAVSLLLVPSAERGWAGSRRATRSWRRTRRTAWRRGRVRVGR